MRSTTIEDDRHEHHEEDIVASTVAVKMVTNGRLTARRGIIFEYSGRGSKRRRQSNRSALIQTRKLPSTSGLDRSLQARGQERQSHRFAPGTNKRTQQENRGDAIVD